MALDNNTVLNYTDKTTLKNYFKTGLKPTQTQFWSTWDSFWHKSETLPISSISGLGNLLDGKAEENHTHSEYATNDATSLTPANVISWQQALGVDDLDYVEIPKENAAENSHPYVVVINDEGKSAKRNATDFGKVDTIDGIEADENKNIALGAVRKSESNEVEAGFDLHQKDGASIGVDANGLKVFKGGLTATFGTTSINVDNLVPDAAYKFQEILFPKRAVKNVEEKVYPVTYIQGVKADETGRVDISGIAWNYTSPSIRYSGILDKSADATYNQFAIFDSNGYLAKATNAYNLFMKGVENWTQEQCNAFSARINNNAGQGTMSIGAIYPAVLPIENYETTFIVTGSNLNLSQDQRKVEIVKNDIVVMTVEGALITVNSALEFTFRKNLSSLGAGRYKIRVWSGLKSVLSEQEFQIIENLVQKDFSTLQWDILNYEGYVNTQSIAAGKNVFLKQEDNSMVPIGSIYLSAKSEPLFRAGEDFYIELDISDLVTVAGGISNSEDRILDSIGIMYNSTANILMPLGLVKYNQWYGAFSASYTNLTYSINNTTIDSVVKGPGDIVSKTYMISILKQGNVLIISGLGKSVSTVIANNEDYSLIAQLVRRRMILSIRNLSSSIIKSYKIN